MSFSESLTSIVAENRNHLLAKHATWERASLGDIAAILNGFPFPSESFSSTGPGTPLIRIRDILQHRSETFFAGAYDTEFLVRRGDLLVGMDGDFNSSVWRGSPGLLNQRCCKISLVSPDYDPRFLAYALPGYLAAINAHTSAITVKHLSSRTVSQIPLPLPPRREQTRIADALDELLSDLDAAIGALERAQAKLKHYRTAVLKAAVEGTLTAEWRARHPATEPASGLLAGILTERRRRWEEGQVRKFKEAGKGPPKNWRAKYQEPSPQEVTALPALPEGWCWANLDAMIVEGPQNGVYYPGTRYGSGCRILRIDDYQNGWLRPTEQLRQVSAGPEDAQIYFLSRGDLVINRVNSMTHLGKCLVVSSTLEGCLFESNMMRSRLSESIRPAFVELYLHSSIGRHRLTKGAKWAVNQASINQQDVKRTAVPLPPLAEQEAIIEMVEDQISVIDHLEADLAAKLKSAQSLRQSILRHAFTGQLVPQDPQDEPASELLKRIAAGRAERERQAREAKPLNKVGRDRRARRALSRSPASA